MRLWVCCGHGAGDSGAVGHGFTEAERVRALGTRIKELGGDGVVLMDQSRNWYADKGLNSLGVPAGDAMVELHMDSGSAGARGGHVIIAAGAGGPDAYDRALADGIASYFPGRSNTLVERSDLANPKRALARGINYRLVENGFISNAGDVATFNARMDDVARLYLTVFGIPVTGGGGSAPEPERAHIDRVERGVYRVRDDRTGTHLFTQNALEAESLVAQGWDYEGVAWLHGDGDPVQRLYNPTTGEHMLTASVDEHNSLVASGWLCEGEAFGQGSAHDVCRLYDRRSGFHMFTASEFERDSLVSGGWSLEGVAFRAN